MTDGLSPALRLARRRTLQLGVAGTSVIGMTLRGMPLFARQATPGATPISGATDETFAALDALVVPLMASWDIPGAQLAIGYGEKLVYSRGFGYADLATGEPVLPTHLFRIASTSKPITGVAILTLVQEGRLTLDTPVFPLLALEPAPNATIDPRLDEITVGQLLVHAGGWDSAGTGVDPQYLPWPLVASHILAAENPAEGETLVRYMLGKPLDFDPGTQSSYSNFGFNVLGRVIEKVSGEPYEDYVRNHVLIPAGITDAVIGGTTLAERVDGEVVYHGASGDTLRESVYPGEGYVPTGYGSYYLRSLDAHGGWICSAEDLIRFALAIDGTRGEALLTPEIVTVMETSPRPVSVGAGAGNTDGGSGLAWNTVAVEGGYEWSHAGALEGSNASWLFRAPSGISIAWTMNTLPVDYNGFFGALIPELQRITSGIVDWPDTDLFA